MSKDIRSISAHEPVKHPRESFKLTTYRNNTYVKPFWPESDYYDKETLYIQLKSFKEDNNLFKIENIKLKTKLQQCEKDLQAYERVCNELQKNNGPLYKTQDKLIMQIKKLNKDLTQQLQDKIIIIDSFKKNIKATKIQELEVETKILQQELNRLREYIVEQDNGLKELQSQIKQQQQCDIQSKNSSKINMENIFLKEKIKELEEQIKQQKIENTKITQKYSNSEETIHKLQTKIKCLENEIKVKVNKTSTQSFRSRTDKQGTESSTVILKPKYQEELQYKLMLRGITLNQFGTMIAELKQQADDMNKQISKEDIEYILTQEPFQMNNDRVKDIVKTYTQSGHKLADQFLNSIGKFKTFYDYPNFSLEESEQTVITSLKNNQKKAQLYLKKQSRYSKEDVLLFLEHMKFGWDESTQLFYLLNLFEKAGQKLEFDVHHLMDPFPTIPQESSRIVEESDEDLFDQQSDYSNSQLPQYEKVNEATEEQESDTAQK